MTRAPRDVRDIFIAIICALPLEAEAVHDALDIVWDETGHRLKYAAGDNNSYTLGVLAEHNVVLVHMPGMGTTSASAAARDLQRSFPNIELVLLVGICGGAPGRQADERDIFLGDLVVSTTVVQYDFGRQYPAEFKRKDAIEDSLGPPTPRISSELAKLKALGRVLQDKMAIHLDEVQRKRSDIKYPGQKNDRLFASSYLHKHQDTQYATSCSDCASHPDSICDVALDSNCADLGCDPTQSVERISSPEGPLAEPRVPRPNIHFGRIGWGNMVMKSGRHRDQIAYRDGIIAFEMEGAGVWGRLPSLVVKAVCDYADSHKDKKWQAYAALVAAAGAKAILHWWPLTSQPRRELDPSAQRIWLMPFARDSKFVNRAGIMDRLEMLLSDDEADDSARVSLTGLGGVGKSQIAIEYAYRLRKHDPGRSIFWVHASGPARLRASYENIAREAQLPGYDDQAADHLTLTYQWLQSERSGRWLLILDNVDDFTFTILGQTEDGGTGHEFAITKYIPQRLGSAVLITTRDRRVASLLASDEEHVVSLPMMSNDEALKLASSKILSTQGDEHDRIRLCASLECLPLAITQAAAYITQNRRTTIAKYLDMLDGQESERILLLTRESGDLRRDSDFPNSLIRTWEMSFRQIQSQSQTAANILSLMAIFDRQSVPEFLLLSDDESEFEFQNAVNILLEYAFVVEAGQSTLNTHRLVKLATQAWLRRTDTLSYWRERALSKLAQTYPIPDYENWNMCQALEPHAVSALQSEYDTEHAELQLALILKKRAGYLSSRGSSDMACQLAESSVQKYTLYLGGDHIVTTNSKHYLARIVFDAGQHSRAERIYRDIIPIQERERGEEHHNTLMSKSNLAHVLIITSQYAEAEQILRAVILTQDAVQGEQHPNTLVSKSSLANVLVSTGQYAEAEQILRAVILVQETVKGAEYPDTLRSVWHLARTLASTGANEEALRLYQRASSGLSAALGPNDVDAVSCQEDLDEFKRELARVRVDDVVEDAENETSNCEV